ncbi:MAG: metal-dependent transcriptional regulator [Candidatus Euphemobacter frigidus]|nr:metal-dependent transcriptional regulator [Candidatus Euphemobacter frigidus]
MITLSPVLEDYLEVVLRFQRKKHFARVSDISTAMGVGKSAVTAALKSLSKKGLLNYQPYEPVTLSREGQQRAERILFRRRILRNFLEKVLTIEKDHAEAAAGKMEHAVDKEVLDRFVCFLAFISRARRKGKILRDDFRQFIDEGIGSRSCQQCIDEYLKDFEREID